MIFFFALFSAGESFFLFFSALVFDAFETTKFAQFSVFLFFRVFVSFVIRFSPKAKNPKKSDVAVWALLRVRMVYLPCMFSVFRLTCFFVPLVFCSRVWFNVVQADLGSNAEDILIGFY